MPSDNQERNRMIVDLPSEVQLAIRLRAVKSSTTTGAVVCEAVHRAFARDVEEAKALWLNNIPRSRTPDGKRPEYLL